MVKLITQTPKTGRKMRKPMHDFNLKTKPFQIAPFFIAPVLPGETMKNLTMQARVVSDPLASKLVGWWQEYYYFYVKHRDLDGRDDYTEMMLDPDKDMSTYQTAASTKYNHYASGMNWCEKCVKRIVEEYFRDEGVAWDAHTIDGLPAASINKEGYWQSAALADAYTAQDVDVDADADNTITAHEIEQGMRMWQMQRSYGLTEMDYDDWLETYGIKKAKELSNIPELIRYVREWTYPSNTVNATDGSVASAASWSIAERADKDRFFREPGFVVGVSVTRPKIYINEREGAGVGMLDDALSWLPAIMRDDPWTSLKKFAHDKGPLATAVTDTDGYWIDVKDLFLHGDTFINYAFATEALKAENNIVDVFNADLSNKYYTNETEVDNLFAGTDKYIRQDGVVNLHVLGALEDSTPRPSVVA